MSKIGDLYKAFVIGDIKNTEEEPNVDKWYAFLNTLKTPADVFEESYNKYLCRMYYFGKTKTFMLNVVSFILLIPLTLRMLAHRSRLPEIDRDLLMLEEQSDVSYKDVFPYELKDQYEEFIIVKREKGSLGKLCDLPKRLYIHTCKKYWAHPYFLMWIMKELTAHSNYIEKYNPKSLVFYINERNVASPILTKLYEDRGGKLISFMHGEYILDIIQAYSRFSEFYVWDPFYFETFNLLRFNVKDYVVYVPKKLNSTNNASDIKEKHFATYYLSGESNHSIVKLGEIINQLNKNKLLLLVRPHPRFSNMEFIMQNIPLDNIENPRDVSITNSVGSANYIVGLKSTVLSEAQRSGKKVIIDDITDKEKYNNLYKRRFIVLNREHSLFSELLESESITYKD